MVKPGDTISYQEMCRIEGTKLQRGMNYRLRGKKSVFLMNLGPNAPYADRIEDRGKTLIYEGHDVPKRKGRPDPKTVDQLEFTPTGSRTQNGLFHQAAQSFKAGKRLAEFVKVYEKKSRGVWTYWGVFRLVDSWRELSNKRKVFKFRLKAISRDEEFSD